MTTTKKAVIVGFVTHWIIFVYSLILFWLGGEDFVRGPLLEARLIGGGFTGIILGLCAGIAAYSIFESAKDDKK